MKTSRKIGMLLAATRLGVGVAARRRRRQRREVMSRRVRIASWSGIGLTLAGLGVLLRRRGMDLRGATVLITGGTRGLGFALAQEFARQGARIAICARNERELEIARAELERRSAEVLAVVCDVADEDQVFRLVAAVLERFGHLDVLVNNAGIITVGPLRNLTLNDFRESMNIMFWGPVHTTFAILPHMLERGSGRIVNVTSIGGKVAVPHLLPYGTAKFAATGFSEGLRAELAQSGISVTTVTPGLMRTGSYVHALVKGHHRAEYTWFSLGDSLPFLSISARRAARQIVSATRRGQPELIISWQAQVLARAHGLLPGLTQHILGVANRFLPAPTEDQHARWTGRASETPLTRSFLTALSQRAMRRYNQFPERLDTPHAAGLNGSPTVVR